MWHDRKILAGDAFDGAIDAQMESADVILLLVSPDFLASRYCYDVEVRRAMELHQAGTARVIAVILRPCDWQVTAFAKLLVTPTDGKPVTKWPDRDEAFLNVVKLIRAALPKSPAPTHQSFPQPAASPVSLSPRSSNLRVKKTFTEVERDRFMDEAFEFMVLFFEGSLEELQKRNPGIETKFKRLDAQCFIAVIYQNGDAVSRCSVRHGGSTSFGNGITYSHDDSGSKNSYSELLSLKVGEQALSLKPMGMSSILSGRDRESHLSQEGASEMYWEMLLEPLQR